MIVIGTAFCFENMIMLIFVIAVVLPLHFVVILSEERHLKELFQDQYEAYFRRTPRFLFKLANYNGSKTVSVSARAISRVTVDALGVLLIPPLANLVDTLHTHGTLPVIWTFP